MGVDLDAETAVPLLVPLDAPASSAVRITREFMLLGSRHKAHVRLVSTTVSRCHAVLIRCDNMLYVRDLGSRTGVLVNGHAVREIQLVDGDTLQVGSFAFRLQSPRTTRSTPGESVTAVLEAPWGQMGIEGRSLLIGRRRSCDLPLDHPDISTTHALIFEMNGAHYVRDLRSRTGTHVNGSPVKMLRLNSGDVVRVGETEFRYTAAQCTSEAAATLPTEDLSVRNALDPLTDSDVNGELLRDETNGEVAVAAPNEPVELSPLEQTVSQAPDPVHAGPIAVSVRLDAVEVTCEDRSAALFARVEAANLPVDAGAVVFSLLRGPASLQSLPPAPVRDGVACAELLLDRSTAGGYVVRASYEPADASERFQRAGGSTTLTIRKAVARLSLSGLNVQYDGAPKPITVITEPFGLSGTRVTYNGAVDPPTSAGRYAVVAQLDHPQFAAASASGLLVIARATQVLAFDPLPDRVYGEEPFTLAACASSGLPVDFSSTGGVRISGKMASIIAAGPATITATQAGDANHAPISVSQSFHVRPAPLTVIIADATRAVGQPNPPLTGTISGLCNGDRISIRYATKATAESPPGNYEITVSLAGPQNRLANYLPTQHPGILTITPAPAADEIVGPQHDLPTPGMSEAPEAPAVEPNAAIPPRAARPAAAPRLAPAPASSDLKPVQSSPRRYPGGDLLAHEAFELEDGFEPTPEAAPSNAAGPISGEPALPGEDWGPLAAAVTRAPKPGSPYLAGTGNGEPNRDDRQTADTPASANPVDEQHKPRLGQKLRRFMGLGKEPIHL